MGGGGTDLGWHSLETVLWRRMGFVSALLLWGKVEGYLGHILTTSWVSGRPDVTSSFSTGMDVPPLPHTRTGYLGGLKALELFIVLKACYKQKQTITKKKKKPCFTVSCGCWHSLVYRHIISISACVLMLSSFLCVCLISLSPPLIRTFVMSFRATR